VPKDKSWKPWMDPRTHNSNTGSFVLERTSKMQEGGRVGKELLKRRGAKGEIPH